MEMIPLEQITPGTQTTSVAKPGVLIDTKALEALAEPMGKSAKMRIRQIRQWILQRGVLDFDRMTDIPAGSVSGLKYAPTVHVHYGEKVMSVRDGLPKFKDFPKEFGGSGDMLPE